MDPELDPLQIIQHAFEAADEIRLMAASDVDSNEFETREDDIVSHRSNIPSRSNMLDALSNEDLDSDDAEGDVTLTGDNAEEDVPLTGDNAEEGVPLTGDIYDPSCGAG